ncbi:hypothetical protein OCA97_14835 [Bacillus cereus]|nr:hypothetical protein [Bacillus cereus]
MSETVKYKQMSYKQLSIYDFLPEEKSQEVQPSETVPQVDEAQETVELYADGKLIATSTVPSSDLDTRAPNTLDIETYKAIVEECEEAFQPTEDTDSTLFSVGDKARVRVPDFEDSEAEDYYFLKALEGKHFKVLDIDSLHITCEAVSVYDDKIYQFYHYEVRRVK